ncbi:hypothetical protein GF407_06720 [candidate division KSB1 bacterium]|nr:hypothetical protein [candidate division KSB1 bacterium]
MKRGNKRLISISARSPVLLLSVVLGDLDGFNRPQRSGDNDYSWTDFDVIYFYSAGLLQYRNDGKILIFALLFSIFQEI